MEVTIITNNLVVCHGSNKLSLYYLINLRKIIL